MTKSAPWLSDATMPLETRMLSELSVRLSKATGDHSRYEDDPLGFIRDVLGVTLWKKQQDIAMSVLNNRRTVVPAGHSVGKSYLAVDIVAWWLETHLESAKVIVLAPTFAQIENVIWRGIRAVKAEANLSGHVYQKPRWEIADHRFAIGLSPKKSTKEDIASLQGYHDRNLLVVLDEGPGLPAIMWEAIEGLATSTNNRILALGNPISQAGPFWNATVGDGWNTIEVSCLDHPNVTENQEIIPGAVSHGWVKDMIRDYASPVAGETPDSFCFEEKHYEPTPVFCSRVLGMAPTEASDQLIALSWVSSAQGWIADNEGELLVGVDPARKGGDSIVLCKRRGAYCHEFHEYKLHSLNPTPETVGWIKSHCDGATKVFVDEIGIGSGILDGCRQQGIPVIGIGFGRAARNRKQFANVRAECWWRVREALQRGHLSLPQIDRLVGDLTSTNFWYDKQARVLLEPKLDVKNRLGRSPDYADALALTYAHSTGIDSNVGTRQLTDDLSSKSRWHEGATPSGGGLRQGSMRSRWRR